MSALELRCSGLPLAFRCGGSVRPDGLGINETNEAATVGSAAHEALAGLVETGRVDWSGVPELASKHNIPAELVPELRMLIAQGAKLWGEVKESFPHASAESEFGYEDDA
jgi:hypothetical protein